MASVHDARNDAIFGKQLTVYSQPPTMNRPLFRPADCAAIGGPTISRVEGCINDEMLECIVCNHAAPHDMTDNSFFGFPGNCPYGQPVDQEQP
jgi:hypothetical protein